MTPSNPTRRFLELNLTVLFMSTSGPFGKFIALPAPLTIELRTLLAFIFLLIYCKIRGVSFHLNRRDIWPILITSILMGVHLVTYFHALQLSNVAIGMLSLFTYPIMTSFLEPIFLKEVPTEVYPKIEKILLDLLKHSGYPNVKFENKVDFNELYKNRGN